MRRSTRPEPISAPSSKTSIIEAGCIRRSATNPRLSSKPNSANSKPSERTQPRLCHSNPVSQPRGAVQVRPSAFDRESEPADSLSKAQRPQSARLAFEDRCVAVAVGEFDLDRAVVVEFGRAVAGNLVRFVRSFPGEPDRIVAVFDVETRMERAEGYFAPTVVADRHRRRPAEVEIGAIPNVGLEDPPAADELAVSRRHPRASRLDRPYLRSASRTFCDARPLTGMPFFP